MDGGPRTATSTFTQLLSFEVLGSGSVLPYVHRDRKDYQGRGGSRTATSTFTQLMSSETAQLHLPALDLVWAVALLSVRPSLFKFVLTQQPGGGSAESDSVC